MFRVRKGSVKGATRTRSRFPAKFAGAVPQKLIASLLGLETHSDNPCSPFLGIKSILVDYTRKLPRFAPPREGGTLAGSFG